MDLAKSMLGASTPISWEGYTILATRTLEQVDLWDTSDWSLLASFKELSCGNSETSPNAGLEISLDNRWFLTSGHRGTGVYSMLNGSELYFFSTLVKSSPSISKDGNFITVSNNRDVIIVETTNWTEVTNFRPLGSSDLVCTWSYDGSKLAVGDRSDDIIIYETSGWTPWSNLIGLDGGIRALSFSFDDALLGASTSDITNSVNVMYVDPILVSGSAFLNTIESATSSTDNAFSNTEFIGSNNTSNPSAVMSWDIIDWSVVATSGAITTGAYSLSVSSDNKQVAIGGSVSPYLTILNVSDLTPIADTLPVLFGNCSGVAWNHP